MRECPKCGYKDPPYWRHVRFRIFTDCCHIEDFRMMFPDLAERIVKEIDLVVRPYIYHFVKKALMVQRIHVDDSLDGTSWREPEQEKAVAARWFNPGQTLLSLNDDLRKP